MQRDGSPDLVDQPVLDHLVGELDGVEHRLRVRRAVADDAHAVDAEQHRAAVRVGADLRVQRQQRGQQRVGVRLVLLLGSERLEQRVEDDPQRRLRVPSTRRCR